MSILKGPKPFLICVAAAFGILPVFANNYLLYIGNVTAIYIVLTVGFNLVLGNSGLLTFVNGALFGVGAYTAAILKTWYGVSYVIALPSSAIAALVIGVIIAMPALRLSGLYLAMASVAFAQTALWVFLHWDAVTGGPTGIRITPVQYPFHADPALAHYYFSLLIAILVVILAFNFLQSRIGRALIAVRESEVAAESLAIDLVRVKTLSYAVSAGLAGLAGGLFAPLLGLVVPESYDLAQVILQLTMVVVGGLGSVTGSVIGAIVLVWMQESLRSFKEFQEIAFGGMILLTVLFLPGGIVGLVQKWFPSWRDSFHRDVNRL